MPATARTVRARSVSSWWGLVRADQFADRLSVGQDRHWAARVVIESVFGVDAQVPVHRGEDVVRCGRGAGWVLAARVGGADDLSHPQATARYQSAVGVGPVVAAEGS